MKTLLTTIIILFKPNKPILFIITAIAFISIIHAQTTVTFNYTGAAQSWTVPTCVTSITIDARGGAGGGPGGLGAMVTATLTVTPGQVLQINVGGAGSVPGAGWNGGGTGQNANTGPNASFGGGGASDIRVAPNGLANRLVVAAGGGGMGGGNTDAAAGVGGCTTGADGITTFGFAASGGTQSSGGAGGAPWISSGNWGQNGSLGQGGAGATDPCYNQGPGGGGGGGYYGGGGGGSDCYNFGSAPGGGGGGGGGSSLTPSGGTCTQGYQSGNGLITITYTASAPVAGIVTAIPNTICAGQTTTLTLTGYSGTIQWQVSTNGGGTWSNIGGATVATYTTTALTTNTCYRVAVTNCSTTVYSNMVCITVNPLPVVTVTPSSPAICSGASATLTAGGAATYSWSGGLGNANPVTVTPASTTVYTVTGTDVNGCTGTADITVTVNPNPTVSISSSANPICAGASTTLTAGGATTYSWSGGLGTANPVTVTPVSTTTYTITGTTAGCTGTASITVTINSNPTVSISASANLICAGTSTTLTAGGTTTYSWSGGLGTANPVTVSPTSTTTYTVTGTTSGCTGTASITVNVNPNPTVSISASANPICSGASATLTAGGATTYSWSGGLGNANPVIVTPASTTVYTVTGTDVNGCTGTADITVTVNPNPTVSISSSANPICEGTSTTLTAGGATTYSWSGGLGTANPVTVTPVSTTTYTITGTTAGCTGTASITVTVNPLPNAQISSFTSATCGLNNGSATATGGSTYLWSNGQTTATITGLAPGNYSVTVTSAAGCSSTTSVTINNIPVPTVTASSTNENCGNANGTASSTPVGGIPPYLYLWSNFQSSQNISSLPANTYTVTVTDANGCTASASTIVINIAGPSLQVLSFVNDICTYGNGSVTVNAINGLPPYLYLWSNGDNSATTSNLHAGTYTCTVTDANNCTAFNSVTITDTPGPTVNLGGINQASCGLSDGSATMNINGGLQPYIYTWNSNPPQSTQNLQNVPTGSYCLTVTDANGCSATNCVTVGENPGPSATSSSVNEICDQANGSAIVNPSGGAPPYTYLWSDGQTTQTATGLTQGSYTVTVSDQGCFTVLSVGILETPGPDAGFSAHPKVLTIMDGPVSFLDNSSGNVVNWNWNFGDGSFGSGVETDHPYTNIGTYVVTLIITDNNGCMDTTIDTIKVKDIFAFYIPNAFTPNEDGYNEYFTPRGVSVDPNNFEMYIFDRWGTAVFQTTEWNETLNQAAIPWNGTKDNKGIYKDVIMDVYIYRIIVKEIDGPKHEYIGRISLIP